VKDKHMSCHVRKNFKDAELNISILFTTMYSSTTQTDYTSKIIVLFQLILQTKSIITYKLSVIIYKL